MLEKLLQWDQDVFIYLNSLGVELFDPFWIVVTNIFTWIPLFILFFVLISLKFPKRQTFFITLTVVALIFFILFATQMTKELVLRLRPNNNGEINSFIRILKNPSSYSFFSGHSSSSFSITTIIVLFLRRKIKWVWLFYAWPLLFVYSRIYVGVHYPIDIFVGALVGVGSAFIFYGLYKKFILPYLASTHP